MPDGTYIPTPPETALPKEMAALHQSLQIERVVIVAPSVYGTDNAATLAGMKARGAEARGVAVKLRSLFPETKLYKSNKHFPIHRYANP